MNNNPTVCIVMATYNGSKGIKRQIDSILKQTYRNFELFIRDDGSTDNTIEIIQDYVNKYDFIHLIEDDYGNLRPPYSFYKILEKCQGYKYYAFADQDDIWYPEKIQRAISKLEMEYAKEKVLLYVSSYDYKTEKLDYIRSFPKQTNISINKCLYYSIGSGFTLVFTDELKRIALPNNKNQNEMHDRRFERVAICFGKIIYDKTCTAAHIRSEEAVTSEDSSNKNLFIHWIQDELFGDEMPREKKQLRQFMRQYSKQLSKKDRQIIALFASNKKSFKKYIRKVFYPHRLRGRFGGEIVLRFMFLIGII